jgi:putative hydrolase of the HAD superfamily
MNHLKWVFFDLDNTLWDFDANAREALKVLFERHQLHVHSNYHVDQFISLYEDVNKSYWKKYEKGEVSKEILRTRRFSDTFDIMGVQPALQPQNVWEEYLDICPHMPVLIPGALECLSNVSQKFKIGILTNGFEETQKIKLKSSGIGAYVDYMQSSERIGFAKPSSDFFNHVFENLSVSPENCCYIGDNLETDVWGGIHSGMKTAFFDKDKHFEQQELPAELVLNKLFAGKFSDLGDFARIFVL